MINISRIVILCLLISSCGNDDANVNLETTAVSSPSLEQALIDIGIDTDGVMNGFIAVDNIANITSLPLNDSNITSLSGLEKFTGLKKLEVFNNQLTVLDVSQNTALEQLDFSGNQIASIDLSQNTALTSLVCYDNQITNLDVSQNIDLATLACTNNRLSSIDLSSNINLTQLYCSKNQLSSIDLSSNLAIEELFCFENLIVDLDLGQNMALRKLYCNDNQLTSLNIKNGNNAIVLEFNANGNIDLNCIQIDNENNANTDLTPYNIWFKDTNASYAEDCTML